MARCEYIIADSSSERLCTPWSSSSACLQFVLVSVGNVIVASSPALLCDGQRHDIQVTISGNQTSLLVDGEAGRNEDVEVPTNLFSHSSTFIGGIPGDQLFPSKAFVQIQTPVKQGCLVHHLNFCWNTSTVLKSTQIKSKSKNCPLLL